MRPVFEAVGLNKTYGRQMVLDDVSFVISEGAHIALTGRNGAGKTTLLRIMSQTEEPDTGSVRTMAWTRLGVLDQHQILPDDCTTLAYLCDQSQKQEWECQKLAARFGLTALELALPPSGLSGGYQMRVKLVAMLLMDPTLLLLDEPVNYLDLSTLLLLESFLRNYPGALVLTSHDREFLNNVCTTTWEISKAKLVTFAGNVDTYLDWKEEQAEYLRRTNKRLRAEIQVNQQFADRFRAKASLATRAQSKLRHITKLRAQLRDQDRALPTAAFQIPCPRVPPGTAVRVEDLVIGYGDRVIAQGIKLEIPRGAKVAIVGENGRGKSTLLKTLAGEIPPIAGTYAWWHRADVGYFSQGTEETLDPKQTVLETLSTAAPPDASAERILAAAGAFLFRDDDLEKPCSVLSGGERSRVRLARLVLHEHNVLILDEPTNHLDAETVEVLARALKAYQGTVLIVSHARTFMNALVDRIYEVRNGSVKQLVESYEDYVADLSSRTLEMDTAETEANSRSRTDSDATNRREQALQSRERRKQRAHIEDALTKLNAERSLILAFYFEHPTDYAPEKSQRLSELDEEIRRLEDAWLVFTEKE